MADEPTEAEVLAASAHEAGRAEAAADHAAADATEAATLAEAAALEAAQVGEHVQDQLEVIARVVGEAMGDVHRRLDGIEERLANASLTADVAIEVAQEAADLAQEPVVVVEEEAAPAEVLDDNGLVVATEEAPVLRDPPQDRRKRYRRI